MDRRVLAAAFLVPFGAGALLAYPSDGHAFSRYVGAHGCRTTFVAQTPDLDLVNDWVNTAANGYQYYGTNTWGYATCGMANDSSLDKTDITTVTAYIYDGHASYRVYASACGASPAGGSLYCGTASNNGAASVTGSGTISVTDLSAWGGSFNVTSPYLHFQVPTLSASTSRIFAYAWSD
jgi:hypothetical protein